MTACSSDYTALGLCCHFVDAFFLSFFFLISVPICLNQSTLHMINICFLGERCFVFMHPRFNMIFVHNMLVCACARMCIDSHIYTCTL